MSENEDRLPEGKDDLPIENESIIELVEEFFDEFDQNDKLVDLPEIKREEFGVSESNESDKTFRLKIKGEILQKIKEILNDSTSYYQQHKKYRVEIIQSVTDFTLFLIFGELKKDERKKIVQSNLSEGDILDFDNHEKETYFDIIKSKFCYAIFLLILRKYFSDGKEESFPSKLTYHLNQYGSYLFKYHLTVDDEDSEYSDALDELISDCLYEVEMEKKFLTQFGDKELRELFEVGYKKDWVSKN
jgi:hypothetical protein